MTFQWVVSSRTLNQPHKNKTSCNVVVDVDDVCDVVDNDDDVDVVVVELGQVRADSAGNFFSDLRRDAELQPCPKPLASDYRDHVRCTLPDSNRNNFILFFGWTEFFFGGRSSGLLSHR